MLLAASPYYHCISRVVRKAFLCDLDINTGESYEHRRQWVEDKRLEPGEIFAIDICAYAITFNHYRLVLHINKAQAEDWSTENGLHLSAYFESKLKGLVDSLINLKVACEKMGYKRTVFKHCCEQYFP